MFDHISKHREEIWKWQSIFGKLQGVWKCGQTVSGVFDNIFSIETKTKENTEN